MDVYTDTVEQYRDFAATPPPATRPASRSGRSGSPTTPRCSAGSSELPGPKRQPNLVFAAARWHGVAAPGPYDALRRALLDDDGDDPARRSWSGRPRPTRSAGWRPWCRRSSQAAGPGPLALLEVGASRRAVPLPGPLHLRLDDGGRRTPDRRRAGARGAGRGAGAAAGRAAGGRLARRHRPEPARRHRRRPDGLADDPGLARARRPPGPAGAGDRGGPRRPAVAGRAATCSTSCRPWSSGRRSTRRWSSSTAR